MLQTKIDKGEKLNTGDMIDIQQDTLDIQVRESMDYIITNIQKG